MTDHTCDGSAGDSRCADAKRGKCLSCAGGCRLPKRDGAAAPVGAGADAGAPNKLIVKSLITFTRLSTIESCNIVKKLQNYSPMAWD